MYFVQRTATSEPTGTPTEGATYFNVNENKLYVYNDAAWREIGDGSSNVQTQIDALSGAIDQNTSDISTLQTDIGVVSGAVDQNTSDISALQTNVETLSSAIADLSGFDVQEVLNTVDALSGAVDQNTSDIANVSGAVDQNTSDIANLEVDIATVSGAVDQNSSDISTLQTDIGVVSGAVDQNTSDIANLEVDIATVSGAVDNLQSQVDSLSGNYVTLDTEQTITGLKTFSNDVTINGDLYVNGDEFIVNTETISASDNLIIINGGETGNGVTAGYAGIQVDRGTADPYWFVFDEARDVFAVGLSGDTQAVATREDSPSPDGGVAIWNDSEKRLDIIDPDGEWNSAIVPDTSGVYDLGSSAKPWKDLYLKGSTIYLGNATLSENDDNGVDVSNSINVGSLHIEGDRIEERSTNSDSGDIRINWRGYAGGTSRFRDFEVYDGKEVLLWAVDGGSREIRAQNSAHFVQRTETSNPTGTPTAGSTYYNSSNNTLYIYNSGWQAVGGIGGTVGDNEIAIGTSSGDLTSTTSLMYTTGRFTANNLTIASNDLYESSTNGSASVNINRVGYSHGTTQVRDTKIYDGQNSIVAEFIGSTNSMNLSGDMNLTGDIFMAMAGNINYLRSGNDISTVDPGSFNLNVTLFTNFNEPAMFMFYTMCRDSSAWGSRIYFMQIISSTVAGTTMVHEAGSSQARPIVDFTSFDGGKASVSYPRDAIRTRTGYIAWQRIF
jgi:hypothetical protein